MRCILLFLLVLFTTVLLGNPIEHWQAASRINEKPVEIKGDTITALNNLFQRKRAGSRTGAVIFGALGVSSFIAGVSSGLAGNFLIAGVFGVLTISNASKGKKYSAEILEKLINDYQNGNPLPPDIVRKLKPKDFQ